MIDDFKPVKPPAGSSQSTGDQSEPQVIRPSNASKEAFQTPEEVAAAQDIEPNTNTMNRTVASPQNNDSHASPNRQRLSWPPGKKEIILAVCLLLLLGGVGAWLLSRQPAKPVATPKLILPVKPKVAPVTPATVPSNLSGLPVSPNVNNTPVTGVMIENSTFARPQSGLSQAGVVFEAIAEGGITRFLALYQDTAPGNVGPIRSVRPYYEQWALGFDAAIAHVGGSPDALADINTWGVRNLDEFSNSSSYHRISSRAAPHNVYTAIATLNQLEAKKGYASSTFTSFPRKAAAPLKQPTATTVKLTLSGPVYNVSYSYDASTNSYNRSEGGAAHIDANTNTQISPKVVIALVVPESNGARDSSGAYYSDYQVIGSGTVYVFQDGGVTMGQWSKSSSTAQISFTDAKGAVIKLNPGQTWLTAVTKSSDVSYTP